MKKMQSSLLNRLLVVVALAATMGGCTMAPKYERPTSAVPSEWPTGAAYKSTDVSTNAVTDVCNLKWQEFFPDANLKQVISIALENNLDLRSAMQNVEYYRQVYNIQREELLPAINGNLGVTRSRVPADLSGTGSRITSSRYDANLGVASWEIDFFGRIRSLKDEAKEQYLATEQAQHAAQISLISSVAQGYISYAADREQLTIAEDLCALYTDTFNKVKKKYDLGLAYEIDLARAQSQVAISKRSIATYTQLVAQDKNALDLLLGGPISEELLPQNLSAIQPTREISAGLSSDVLLDRPDVLGAENQLRAANADIGAARASFFPRISLTAAIGSASSDLSGLFESGSGYWSYAPQLVLPIFDTRTWSSHRASKVKKEMMVTAYQKAIQTAFREVADTLASLGTVDAQVIAQEEYVKSVKRTYELLDIRLKANIDNSLNVLDAQRSYRTAQQTLVELRLSKRINEVKLYSVLGGGWIDETQEQSDQQLAQTDEQPVLQEENK